MGMSKPVHLPHRESEVTRNRPSDLIAVINAREVQTARGGVATSEVHAKLEPVARQSFRDGVQANPPDRPRLASVLGSL
jgi:hypothetical protein